MLIDSHCHLDSEKFDEDRDALIERAQAAGVTKMVSIGTGEALPDLEAGIRMAERYPNVLATVGIHPQFAKEAQEEHFHKLAQLATHPKVIAIGEIGLDYYWKPYDAEKQVQVFIRQMRLARDAGKPITIHTREAWPETFALLQEHWSQSNLPCILHCFTGTPEHVQTGIALDCYFSFAGVVTYPKATDVQESAKQVPADRLLIETDAPYLPPVPYRGKRNEPAFVIETAKFLAQLRGIDLAQLAALTSANFAKAFRIAA